VLILTVLQGPDKGKKYELPDHEPQLIGRSSEALPLSDNAVSRRHAELTPDDGLWYIRDLQSQNGTYVNGVRLLDRQRLRPGDQIRCGQSLFVFGQTESSDPDVVRVVGPKHLDATVEKTLPSRALFSTSNEDSMILAEPEPRAAAIDHLRIIYRLTTILTSQALDRQQLLKSVMELVFAEFHPERGCIMLQRESEAQPTPAVVKYKESPKDADDAKIHVSRTILHLTMTKSEGVLSSNAMSDPRFAKGDSVQRFHIRSAICSPIKFRDKVFGAIYIDSSIANYSFTPEQLLLLNAIGQHLGLALSNADLYQQKLQSERLAAIGETVATLSHSIKNILQGLRGGADVVEMGLKKNDLKIATNGWGILKRNLDRIISLTMNMLAFSRQRRIEPELIRVGSIIDECVQLLEGQAATKQVALLADVDPEMPPVPLDSSLIHQALMNLITNAVEAVEPGVGAVTIKASYLPNGSPLLRSRTSRLPTLTESRMAATPAVEIAVIDNGPGIPASKQPWVFEPFNTTKGLKGTGLGLAVAKRIAEEHGGTITLETQEGKGATFRITLPADARDMIDPSATAQSRNLSGPSGIIHGSAEGVRPDDARGS
jgi:signal transduction histidine kinase/pSer/pThr/pTyr-binding forkhead associated (FHA) protein